MVKLLIGHKGSGKTNQMVQLANDCIEKAQEASYLSIKITDSCMS